MLWYSMLVNNNDAQADIEFIVPGGGVDTHEHNTNW
jgi:hypothetical protein